MNPPTRDARLLAMQVVERLTAAGHQAYWAGGCVRDLLLGHIPKDFDVATSAKPPEVQKLFRRTVAVGASFGVISVIGGPGLTIEVATFRSDGTYSDGRRPDQVTFSSAEEDAKRRDFTINGMFFDPAKDEVLDYVGGREDLARGLIRAIGDPALRFREDKLRLLRAIRFASRLGFGIDDETYAALCREVDSITLVSVERILAELRQMIEHPSRVRSIEMLWSSGLFPRIYPELVAASYDRRQLDHSLAVLGFSQHAVCFAWGMAALLASIETTQARSLVRTILHRQRASNDDIAKADWLVSHRDLWRDWVAKPTHALKRVLAHPAAADLFDLAEATERAELGLADQVDQLRRQWGAWTPSELDPEPLVTGKDLLDWGYSAGRIFKEILETVRDKQLDGELDSRDEAEAFIRRRWC
ncbi:CCA tRNA nucleotidyltransferase [bacterium]|nr:CCA tRNA nucleotidyltransferase [bacterium]